MTDHDVIVLGGEGAQIGVAPLGASCRYELEEKTE